MSTFLSQKYEALEPYVPGEQPKDMQYVKLNTNENPFPPSEKALAFAAEMTRPVHLYSDPECVDLRKALSETCGVTPDQVICTNGSDEVLNFAFMAFCDEAHPAVFPDLTYGFYPVFAKVNGVPYEEIPLKDDFSVDPEDYIGIGKNIFIICKERYHILPHAVIRNALCLGKPHYAARERKAVAIYQRPYGRVLFYIVKHKQIHLSTLRFLFSCH